MPRRNVANLALIACQGDMIEGLRILQRLLIYFAFNTIE
jgi:hypothetical protein